MGKQQISQRGFTLIELMIAVVIVGLLAGIGYPSFTNYVSKGRRAEAMAELLQFQIAQESFRARQVSPTYNNGMATPSTTYYSYALSGVSGTAFTVTATAIGKQASDASCATLVITEEGPDISTAVKRGCWSR